MAQSVYVHSLQLQKEKCQGCICCVKACPTDALRVRNGKAEMLADRCIDCGACAVACPYHAFTVESMQLDELKNYAYNIVLPAPSLYAQFSPSVSFDSIWRGLHNLGFDEIFDVSLASEYISTEITEYVMNYTGGRKPLLSSTCPAVLRLIQVKFPELIKQLVPVLPPVEAAAIYVKRQTVMKLGIAPEEVGVWFISPCPSKETNIKQSADVEDTQLTGSFNMAEIYGKLLKCLGGNDILKIQTGSSYGMSWGGRGGEIRATGLDNAIAVSGIRNVYEFLEQVSMNKMPNLDYAELSACSGGCLGGLLAAENRFVAENNLRQRMKDMEAAEPHGREETMARAMVLKDFPQSAKYRKKVTPRPMMQLDEDIMAAMEKFERMEEVINSLPGLDCGACGAPSCQCLAEDIVQGKATEIDCIFKLRGSVHKMAQGMVALVNQIPLYSEPKPIDDEEERK